MSGGGGGGGSKVTNLVLIVQTSFDLTVLVLFQVRERLRVALERVQQLEEELAAANQEVSSFRLTCYITVHELVAHTKGLPGLTIIWDTGGHCVPCIIKVLAAPCPLPALSSPFSHCFTVVMLSLLPPALPLFTSLL